MNIIVYCIYNMYIILPNKMLSFSKKQIKLYYIIYILLLEVVIVLLLFYYLCIIILFLYFFLLICRQVKE